MKKYWAQGGTGNYTENMHSLVYEKDGRVYFPYQRILIKRKQSIKIKGEKMKQSIKIENNKDKLNPLPVNFWKFEKVKK